MRYTIQFDNSASVADYPDLPLISDLLRRHATGVVPRAEVEITVFPVRQLSQHRNVTYAAPQNLGYFVKIPVSHGLSYLSLLCPTRKQSLRTL